MSWAIRGVIEGFYGPPWSWAARRRVMAWCHERGMTHYVYAPKDDPLHRDRWREPYPADELDGFAGLVEAGTLAVGFAISPGLSIDEDDADDRRALAAKVDQVVTAGVSAVWLALDDIPPRPGLGARHARLTTWLHEHLAGRASLALVPTEYTGTITTPYLDALAEGVPHDVPIAWTGTTVVCDEITATQARARADAVGGRSPVLWDNYPVNDAFMVDRLFVGPLRGRDPHLADACGGYLANPMSQAEASLLPLASVAGFLRGEDPDAVWRAEADALGLSAWAEAVDGDAPRQLVTALARAPLAERPPVLADLRAFIEAVRAVDLPPELARESAAWDEQLAAELGLWDQALGVFEGLADGRLARATEHGLALAYLWPGVRRGAQTVLGVRCGARPVLGQWSDGSWRFHLASIQEDRNATDALVRLALTELDAASTAG